MMSRGLLVTALVACFLAVNAWAAEPQGGDALESTLKKGGMSSSLESVIMHDKISAEMARDMLDGRRKGGGKASGGSKSSGGSSWGSSSSSSTKTSGSTTGLSTNGKTTYYNPTPVSSTTKTGTYRTSTTTGRTASAGASTGPSRPFTSSAAAASNSFRASSVSYNTAYGGRAGGGIRPFYIFAGAAVAGSMMGNRRGCSGDRYRFGNSCRQCSTDACPIGQYRTECDAYNDGYCTACSGLSANSYWVTPGNGDNCQSEVCSTQSPCELCPSNSECPAPATTPATASFFVEAPVSQAEWDADSGVKVQEAVATAASPAGVTVSRVSFTVVDEATLDPDDVAAGMESRRRRWAEAATKAQKLLQSEGRTPQGTHGRKLLQNATTAVTTTTVAATTTPPPTTDVGCGAAPPEHDKFVVAVVEVQTTEDKLEMLWQQLTEFNLNVALSSNCQPPATLGYFGAASAMRVSLVGTFLASLLALSVTMFQE